MSELMSIDIYILAALAMGLILSGCLAVLYVIRDPEWAPPRPLSRSLWCAEHRQIAHVDFIESIRTGMPNRQVQRCSLRAGGVRCSRGCCYMPLSEVASESAASAPLLSA